MKLLNILSVSVPTLVLIATAGCSVEAAKQADTTAAGMDTGTAATAAAATPPAAGGAAGAPASPTPTGTSSGGMLDPNSASRSDLASVPGMTDAVITAVTAARPYANMVAVDKVLAKSLSGQQRDSVYTRVWVPIDLNAATGEEILLIPGVGPRMRHEFEEYRPYKSIEQFRREIGKYVDRDEVARLERYVTIR
jgi:DNA uptake protein ComE-like DNA-binding protein